MKVLCWMGIFIVIWDWEHSEPYSWIQAFEFEGSPLPSMVEDSDFIHKLKPEEKFL